MVAGASIYSYTPQQSKLLLLYENYRNSLMNSMYYARRLKWFKRADLAADIIVALAASSAFAGLAIWHSQLGRNVFSALLAISVIVSTLRPVLRFTDKIARYAKLHYGYLEIFYRIQALVSEVQGLGQLTASHESKANDIADRYRALDLESDATQKWTELLKLQDEGAPGPTLCWISISCSAIGAPRPW